MDIPTPGYVTFQFFASLLHNISSIPRKGKAKTRSNAIDPVHKVFQDWVNQLRRNYPNAASGTTSIVFRLLFPEEDVSRRYGLQETTLARHLAEVCQVSTAVDGRGRNLVQWNGSTVIGCLGSEVQAVIRTYNLDTLHTLQDVDMLLTELATTSPFSSASVRSAAPKPRSKRAILTELFRSLDNIEAAFMTQIILKDLRPIVYPIEETHYSTSLLLYNTNAINMLTKEEAMKIWEPSFKMLRAYRFRATLEAAAEIYEDPNAELTPRLGVPIGIPKCTKGLGCSNAIKALRRSNTIWAETKYDGERAQIHVQIDENMDSQITIFSKSKRDSTLDRHGVHHIIREALGLPQRQEKRAPSEDHEFWVMKNVVLEAEMVAYSDTLAKVDEFWRIRSLIASTALGVRHSSVAPQRQDDYSQDSLISNGSDGDTRHLALVFFDVLVLDDESVLHKPYSERRALLGSLVSVIPGYSMLAARVPISLRNGPNQAIEDLTALFAHIIATHEEGLVLKADESRYNDWKMPWIKMKKDYIPGLGDTVDMVILGASWDKNRARELCVAPTVLTTFYLGMLNKPDHAAVQPTSKPHFECTFVVEYGLTREKLEELNFMIRASDPVSTATSEGALPYTHSLYPGLSRPTLMLTKPLVAEIFGAGFTKPPGSKLYELRFSRISKVFRPSERSWIDAVTVQEFQQLARHATGRDRPGKLEDDWCNEVWGKPSSPGVNGASKQKHREEEWFGKLERSEGRSPTRRRLFLYDTDTENAQAVTASASKEPGPSTLPAAMASVTNVAAMPQSPTPGRLMLPPASNTLPSEVDPTVVVSTQCALMPPPVLRRESTEIVNSEQPVPSSSHLSELDVPATLSAFLRNAVVWFARPADAKRPAGRSPSRRVAPLGNQVNTLETFLVACGWTTTSSGCPWADKGVVFVDDSSEQWLEYPMLRLLKWRSNFVGQVVLVKPVWVLSMRVLEHQLWAAEGEVDVESYCLSKLG